MRVEKRRIPSLPCIIIVCMISYLLGAGMISMWQNNIFFQNNVLNVDFIQEIDNLYIDKRALFFLCLKERLGAFFIMLFMSSTIWNAIFVFSFFILHGFSAGCIAELLMIRYGWKGMMIYFSSVFPQCVLYLLSYLMLACWCLDRQKKKTNETIGKRKWMIVIMAFIINLLGICIESMLSLEIIFLFLNV